MDALALTLFYRAFLITADFCPKIPRQVFDDLPLEHDILSFIKDLGHTGDITYLTDVNVHYLYQPWRAFSTVINKCLSGKEIGMDKIRLSRAQILWGMFNKKNIDYVYLLWEDLMFQIENKDAKKTNKMELTNQAMLESKAYQTYYAFTSREKAPKPKYIRKKANSDTSPKKKPVQAAKVAKPEKKKRPAKKTKANVLDVLSEKALDDALVAPVDRLEIRKCNMRLKTDIKPKEATFQVATVSVHKSSIRFTINKKKFSLDVEIFREILQICPKIPGQEFEDLPLEQDILCFIRDLGHTRDITYLTDVNVDYLHQPWRAFVTVINKCLSGKETGMDKIRLSRAQILWGMFHKKNIDYVYLLWEDFLFQIENKEAKKTNKMSYPRFTKIIIDYFMSKDQSISRRKKMFWHTARDDTMFTSMRCIFRHEDTQVYGTILPKELTNQAMLESKSYQTYYAFASGEKAPKSKYIQKKADSDTSPKKKPVQATKGTRLKTSAKVAKSDKKKQPTKMPKAKGLHVLFEVALTETGQIKLATVTPLKMCRRGIMSGDVTS
ncbi:hypothetical protein Tco_0364185 [Tanacetum coccineum]